MDPFNDLSNDDELDENDEENVNEKSFSSRHSNGNDDNNFNRVSLQSAIDDFKRVNSNVIHEKEIQFEISKQKQENNDNEKDNQEEDNKNKTDGEQSDKFGSVQNRKHGFGQDIDSDDEEDPSGKAKVKGNQGMITGVLIPCFQSILGIILFIRLPDITGEAGIFETYIIICMGTSVTLLTTLSMSAIATNGKIGKGGPYYMLSRSLGPATGGSLGLLFYIATTLSGAMYILGSVETFLICTGLSIENHPITIRIFSLIVLVILLAITFIGINYVSKAGIVFFCVTIISLISIFVGLLFSNLRQSQLPDGITGMSWSNFEDNAIIF